MPLYFWRRMAYNLLMDKTFAPLKTWQEEGAAWLAPKTGALLALAPGLGKTRTALEAVERRAKMLGRPLGVLVIVPLSLMDTWKNEINAWSTLPFSLRVLHEIGRASCRERV